MDEGFLPSLIWIGMAAGIVGVALVLEVSLRTLINRFGTPQNVDGFRVDRRLSSAPR